MRLLRFHNIIKYEPHLFFQTVTKSLNNTIYFNTLEYYSGFEKRFKDFGEEGFAWG